MPLYLFLAVIGSLACGGVPFDRPPSIFEIVGWILLAAFHGVILHVVWQRATAPAGQIGGRLPSDAPDSVSQRLEPWRWSGLVVALLGLVGFRLAAAPQFWPILHRSMAMQAAFLLTPALLMHCCWLAAEQRFGNRLEAESGERRAPTSSVLASLLRSVGWLVLPVLTLLMIADAIHLVWPVTAQPSALLGGAITIGGLALLLPFLVPWLATRIWKTRPLDDPQHSWLTELAHQVTGRSLDIRRWETNMEFSNAAVVGFFPHARSLLITDRMLRDASVEQLGLILLHELAHLRRGHLWLRVLAVTPAWLMAAAWVSWIDGGPLSLGIAQFGAIAATLILLRLVAHATEYDADRVACELARVHSPFAGLTGGPDVPGGRSPVSNATSDRREHVNRFCDALRATSESSSPTASSRASWMHPSIDARCQALQAWANASDHPILSGTTAIGN